MRTQLFSAAFVVLTVVSLTAASRPVPVGHRFDPCHSTCAPCDPSTNIFTDGYGPGGYKDASAVDFDCTVNVCDDNCHASDDDQLVADVSHAIDAGDDQELLALWRTEPRLQLNLARHAVQVLSRCGSGGVEASLEVDDARLAASEAFAEAGGRLSGGNVFSALNRE